MNCRFMPGFLIPADLTRIIPPGADPVIWAEANLLASPGDDGDGSGIFADHEKAKHDKPVTPADVAPDQ